jgi:hypothetical protein
MYSLLLLNALHPPRQYLWTVASAYSHRSIDLCALPWIVRRCLPNQKEYLDSCWAERSIWFCFWSLRNLRICSYVKTEETCLKRSVCQKPACGCSDVHSCYDFLSGCIGLVVRKCAYNWRHLFDNAQYCR